MYKDEKNLIQKAKKDPQAFGVLFDRYYNKILNYSVRRVGDLAVAEDITSIVFLKAYKKLWQFHWRGLPLLAWLYRIAGNEVKTYYRKSKKNGTYSLDEMREEVGFEPSVSAKVEKELIEKEEVLRDEEIFNRVLELIKRLDVKYQEAIQLRFFENKKVREVAEVLGKKEGTVKSLLSRGVKKLHEMMMLSELESGGRSTKRDSYVKENGYDYYFKQLLAE